MNIKSPKIIIGPQVRLPFDYIKGSEAKRFACSEKLTNDLFQKIKNLYVTTETDSYTTKTTAVSANVIEEKIQEVLPAPLNIKINELCDEHKNSPDTVGSIYWRQNEKDKSLYINEVGILMNLAKDMKVNYNDVNTLLHEFQHIMDGILNPKIYSRSLKVAINGDPLKTLFHKYINIDEKFNFLQRIVFNIKLNKQMRKLPDELKIDELQEMRNVIKSEINAYSNNLKYQTEINKNLGIKENLMSNEQRLAAFDFDRKLKFLNKKLYRTIKNQHKKHAREIK